MTQAIAAPCMFHSIIHSFIFTSSPHRLLHIVSFLVTPSHTSRTHHFLHIFHLSLQLPPSCSRYRAYLRIRRHRKLRLTWSVWRSIEIDAATPPEACSGLRCYVFVISPSGNLKPLFSLFFFLLFATLPHLPRSESLNSALLSLLLPSSQLSTHSRQPSFTPSQTYLPLPVFSSHILTHPYPFSTFKHISARFISSFLFSSSLHIPPPRHTHRSHRPPP